MPDIFDAEETTARDRRFVDENPSELAIPVTQEVVEQTLSSQEHISSIAPATTSVLHTPFQA